MSGKTSPLGVGSEQVLSKDPYAYTPGGNFFNYRYEQQGQIMEDKVISGAGYPGMNGRKFDKTWLGSINPFGGTNGGLY